MLLGSVGQLTRVGPAHEGKGRGLVLIRSVRPAGHLSYDLLHTVEQSDGIVVVAMTGRYWLLPAEVFDTASLVALRQRAGRRPFPQALLVG